MTQSQTAVKCFALAHRENAGRGRNPAVAHDYAAIVQCGFGMENRQHQFDGKIAVEGHAGFFVNANRSVTLNRNQRAELLVGQLRHGLGQIVNRLAFLAR